jgi:hypothetical protein
MSEENAIEINKVNSYALFVNNTFKAMYYFPAEGFESALAITAALQSNPTIVFDGFDGNNTNIYSVFVEEEEIGQLYIPTVITTTDFQEYINDRNFAFQNNPTVVWVNSETLIPIDAKYSYDGNTLTLIEE